MRWKTYVLGVLCLATITACAHPMDRALGDRAVSHEQGLVSGASISGGACDDVGQFIPSQHSAAGVSYEASAAPTDSH